MGKIVKHCVACDESFAEKFGYCPNCGESLQAFELNPLADKAAIKEDNTPKAASFETFETKASAPISPDKAPVVEPATVTDSKVFSTNGKSAHTETFDADEFDNFQAEEPAADTFVAAAAETNGNGYQGYQTSDYNFQTPERKADLPENDGFHVTVIEEKNLKQRNLLLLGSLLLMTSLALGGIVYSIFNQSLLVGAIDNGDLLAFVPDVDPVPIEAEKPEKKNNNKGGGGGGGGKEEQKEASKGRLVSQSEKPITPPSVNIPQLKNPSLPVIMETQGKIKRPITEERPGLPNSSSLDPSNGTGSGGGIGSGRGTGMGGGIGTGEGNGRGSGSGNGNGNGNGNGTGNGDRNGPPPPPPVAVGPTTGINIISKPRPNYTDAARQNQVTGTVTLRVTFNANGQIGGVSPVSGLPYGLTEQAIAAARNIKFEPAKRNGVPQTVTKQIQYSFTIY